MFTTACETCRKVRMRCVRPSRGTDEGEECERCLALNTKCITIKRRVGRQAGVKNRKPRSFLAGQGHSLQGGSDLSMARTSDHLPNPLHVLASQAVGHDQAESASRTEQHESFFDDDCFTRQSSVILERYSNWTAKVDCASWKQSLSLRLDGLLQDPVPEDSKRGPSTTIYGRTDIVRPDASPEHDPISLRLLSLSRAEFLFDSFLKHVTNGSMYFDPRLHTLTFVRNRSSYLLTVILALTTAHTSICSSSYLHHQLVAHAYRVENHIQKHNLRSIEIAQASLLLATWCDIPANLSHDKTWLYVSRALAMAVELRLDSVLPHCVQDDPLYNRSSHHLLLRNAQRTCLMLFIRDRNIAMMAGRNPVYPESSLMSPESLAAWGKHARANRFDGSICASVALRQAVIRTRVNLGTQRDGNLTADLNVINSAMAEWRSKWAEQIKSTLEYDVIARFSTFVLTLTLTAVREYEPEMQEEARKACEMLSFDVCCAVINHYKSWPGLLNSGTYDTSMLGFCASFTIQSINVSPSKRLSDWSMYRLATLQELVAELESQASALHAPGDPDCWRAVDVMARQIALGIRMVLRKQPQRSQPADISASSATNAEAIPSNFFTNEAETIPMENSTIDYFAEFMSAFPQGSFLPGSTLDTFFPDALLPDPFQPDSLWSNTNAVLPWESSTTGT